MDIKGVCMRSMSQVDNDIQKANDLVVELMERADALQDAIYIISDQIDNINDQIEELEGEKEDIYLMTEED